MTPRSAPRWPRPPGGALAFVLALVAALLVTPGARASTPPAGPGEPADAAVSTALEAVRGDDSGLLAPLTEPAAPDGEVSQALRELWLERAELAGPDRRTARSLLARPTVPAAHGSFRYPTEAAPMQACTERVCVTHVTSTRHASTPAWAAQTLRLLEASWTRIVDRLGYRPPAADAEQGGDPRFDVYLADLSSQGYYGFCAPEDLVPGQRARASAYCVLDNDMAGLGAAPLEGLAATTAHEFFHAVQYNYDVAEDPWFMEASATWMEEQVFDDVDDNRQFLGLSQLGDPTTPLDSTRSMYGNWIFLQWLAQRYGTHAVRQVWERLDASTGERNEWSLQGIARLVATRGGSWPRLYAGFARANLLPGRHYEEGRSYRAAAMHDRVRLGRRTSTRTRTSSLAHLTSRSLQVTWSDRAARGRSVAVRVRSTRGKETRAQVLVLRKDGSLGVRQVRLGPRGRGAVRIPTRRVHRVVVLLSHTAVTYRRCGQDSGWACGGQPVGDLRASVTTALVR